MRNRSLLLDNLTSADPSFRVFIDVVNVMIASSIKDIKINRKICATAFHSCFCKGQLYEDKSC